MAAHSAPAAIPPVPPDQPPGAWATWLREIAQVVNLLGARINDPPSPVTITGPVVFAGTDDAGVIPDSQPFGLAITNNYDALSEVDFWAVHETAGLGQAGGFQFRQKRASPEAPLLLGYLYGDSEFAQLDISGGGVNGFLGTVAGGAPEGFVGTNTAHNFSVYVGNVNVATFNTDLSTQFVGPIIQKPLASATPAANGDLVVEATSDTSLTFRSKGSAGVVRSASLTLT
jgi:hypothetical protein